MSQTSARQQIVHSPVPEKAPAKEAPPLSVITPTSDVAAIASPANGLRTQLQEAIEGRWNTDYQSDAIAVQKIPFGWTLIGMSLICAAFWYAVVAVIL